MSMPLIRVSPLARKLCVQFGLSPQGIPGTGPRGKVMAADVECFRAGQAAEPASGSGSTRLGSSALVPNREMSGDYFHFSMEADMAKLAAISTPIAVQCEKLLNGRYSLFDYIVRAVVKACLTQADWLAERGDLNVLLVEDGGMKLIGIEKAASKSIYKIAQESREGATLPEGARTDVVVCDVGLSPEEVADRMGAATSVVVKIEGTSPKVRIECGRPVSKLILPVTLYVNSRILNEKAAGLVAGELKTLLENPVILLLL